MKIKCAQKGNVKYITVGKEYEVDHEEDGISSSIYKIDHLIVTDFILN